MPKSVPIPPEALPLTSRLPSFTERLADASKQKLRTVQEYFSLAGKSLRFAFVRPFYAQDLVQQMDEIGVKSLGIVLLTHYAKEPARRAEVQQIVRPLRPEKEHYIKKALAWLDRDLNAKN